MQNKKIILNKEIQTFIETPAFLFTTKIKIDFNYFIKRIDQGILEENNKNYITSVGSKMTDWNYFINDNAFLRQVSEPAINVIENRLKKVEKFKLQNAWGLKQEKNEKTHRHDHDRSYFSGVVYLNQCGQILYFDSILQEIKPEKGLMAIFSGNLEHYTHKNMSNTKYALSFNYVRI